MFMYSYCYVCCVLHILFSRANWHSSAILTEVCPCLFLSCKANTRGITRKDGARPALFPIRLLIALFLLLIVLFLLLIELFYVLFVCKCVLYYCHWVSTQLQLTNISSISYHQCSQKTQLQGIHAMSP